jgi:hypothetical protein
MEGVFISPAFRVITTFGLTEFCWLTLLLALVVDTFD